MTFLMTSPPRPSSETPPANAQAANAQPDEIIADAAPASSLNSRVAPRNPERVAAHCERCDYEWFSRTTTPVRCPHCGSRSWNKPRVYKLAGKPDPTRQPKVRGQVFTSETAQEAAHIRHSAESEAREKPPSPAKKETE